MLRLELFKLLSKVRDVKRVGDCLLPTCKKRVTSIKHTDTFEDPLILVADVLVDVVGVFGE
jgi:hypothetical protein